MAKYTFFEVATQKGYLLEIFDMLLPRHWERQPWGAINSDEIGLVAKPHGEETVLLDFRTTGRQVNESNQIWRDRVRAEAEAAWEVVRKAREEYARKLREDTLAAEAAAKEKAEASALPAPEVKVKAAKTAKVKSDKSESVPSPRSAAN